jgi:hypothetical protein
MEQATERGVYNIFIILTLYVWYINNKKEEEDDEGGEEEEKKRRNERETRTVLLV